ncbi:MAG: hypothetical protein ACRD15_11885, partial [Vicinamibacterales bacterium]
MSLRTRLIIAFLLLSVVPLSAVTFVTYRSSIDTFENAAHREASQSAVDIGRRMERITADVGRRMDRLFVSAPTPTGATGRASDMRDRIAPMLGETAALVERMEFHPALPPHAPPPPAHATPETPPLPPPPGVGERRGRERGRGRRPQADVRSPAPPQIIVVDVQQAIEDAKRAVRTEVAAAAPELATLIEESLNPAWPAAEAAVKGAMDAAARSREAQAAAREMQMHVAGRRVEIAVKQDGKVVGKA